LKRIVLQLPLLFCYLFLSAQIDTEFWFVAPEIAEAHGDRPIFIRISTMQDTANIVLWMPANLSFIPITQTINPNSTYSINLTPWIDIIENRPADQVLNRGLLLTSDNDVTAYYECASTVNPGIFSLKGKNAVGTDFYIVSQNDYWNSAGQESFDIVATEDNTNVMITPSDDIVGHPAGLPFEITLNKGQTYTARAVHTTAEHTLSGSKITSDKPIAISWQDDTLQSGGCADVICDQIVPTNILGWEYIAIKGYADTDERIYAVAIQDNTDIMLDGNPVPVATIQTGELYKYQIPDASNTVYLKASYPVYVLHISGFNCELGGSILPQDSCTGSLQIGFNRTNTNDFALLILTRNGFEGGFLLNGSNAIITTSDFSVVPGTNDGWVFARKQMTTTQVPVGANLIENTLGKFHLGIVHKTGPSAEYGYFSDFSDLYLGADQNICPGDSVILDGGSNMTTYEWYKLVSSSWTLIDTNRFYTVYDSGFYACLTSGTYCTLTDTIHIGFYPNVTVDIGPDTTICAGTTITLDPGLWYTYLWSTGSIDPTLAVGLVGQYWVKATNINGCVARDTMILYVDYLPMANHAIEGPDSVCQGQDSVYYHIDSLHFASSYIWTTPPGATGTSDTSGIVLDFATTASSGLLKVRGHNYCGDGPDTSMIITVKPIPGESDEITGPNTVCQNDTGVSYFTHTIPGATFYDWVLPPGAVISGGAGTNNIMVDYSSTASSGDIIVSGQNECGNGDSIFLSVAVQFFPAPAGNISGEDTLCQGTTNISCSVDTINGASSYIWSIPPGASITSGDSTRSITVSFDSTAQSGNIVVKGVSECGVGDSAVLTVTVHPVPWPAGPIAGEDTVCQGQTGLLYLVDTIQQASSYIWTVPAGAFIVTGNSTPQIMVDFSSLAQDGTITVKGYNVMCGEGQGNEIDVAVNPLPDDAGMITGTDSVCQNETGIIYSIQPIQYATSYLWTYSGTGVTITNNGTNAILDFSPSATSGILTVNGENACGSGIGSPGFTVGVFPGPDVSLQICQTITTRDSQPFLLQGGIPLGGTFYGDGISAGWFNPSLVSPGTDTVTIDYSYTNMYNCSHEATQQIVVKPTQLFNCGDFLLDVRDSALYPTIMIGTQCWIAANMNYGITISSTQLPTDNCIPEKYCYNDAPFNCTNAGGLYLWNELMQYGDSPALQGFCPPGWHVPTEAEWITLFNQWTNNAFAGSPLKVTGYSGFNALLTGIRFHGSIWKFPADDPLLRSILFWSSTSHGPTKAWAHGINQVAADDEYTPSVSFYPAYRSNAFAIRCVKD